jgi:peptidoglycan/LPS O-acetylase OafA/YrhL
MKKSFLALIISLLVLITAVLWLLNTKKPVSIPEIIQYGIILVLVGFGVYVGISRLKSEKTGEPAEDELSVKILRKASSSAYYISIYMWLVFMYLSDKVNLESHSLIGAGILGMAVLFCLCWIFYKIAGLKDA